MSLTFSPLLSFIGEPICLYLFCGGEECLGSVAFPFAGDVDFTMVTEDSLNYIFWVQIVLLWFVDWLYNT